MKEEVLLAQALALSPPERAAFLENACGADDELRRRLEERLQPLPAEEPESTGAYIPAFAAVPEAVGSRIGPYKLLQKLGEGGMGSVYLAEQTDPVQRRVALKIIKPGMDSRQVIARFEQERQALAMMDHPNIAKVLDAGTVASSQLSVASGKAQGESDLATDNWPLATAGRPFFVMELVKGIPITKFCDQEHLTPRERLALFLPVCQAVQHAHQKGIIHRDLKPSNVLVALYDGKPVPKVIDFGVAKATAQKLTEKTMFTEVGMIVGTLEYMAPEQAELNNLDIDTRADIYSLGVMLYELLTGTTPFSSKQLRNAAFDEMLRIIREVEPPRPSTKISSSEGLPTIAANRKLEPKKLSQFVQGDLDWIVMKCLEKERSRRYETANQLGLEIQRFLADEPIQAGPPGMRYRLGKFVRRNKGPVTAASVILLSLLLGIVGTTTAMMRAWAAESQATEDRNQKEKALHEAVAAEQARRQELGKTAAMAAKLASQQGRWEEAIGQYETALAMGAPDEVGLRLGRLRCRYVLAQFRKYKEELQALIGRRDLGARAAEVQLEQGYAALMWNDLGNGPELIRQAIPNLPPAQAAFAKAILAQTVPEAITHLQEALRHDPYHASAQDYLAMFLALTGRRNELREAVAQLRLTRPDSPWTAISVLFLHGLDGDRPAVQRGLPVLRKQLPAEMVPFIEGLLDFFLAIQNEDIYFNNRPQEKMTAFMRLAGSMGPMMAQMGGDTNPNEAHTLNMQIFNLPLFQEMRELPPIKELSNPLAALALMQQPAKVADLLGALAQRIPDGSFFLNHGKVLEGLGRLKEAEAVYRQALESPSIANHRRPAWFHLVKVQ
jgi:serine/threonine protein kinase